MQTSSKSENIDLLCSRVNLIIVIITIILIIKKTLLPIKEVEILKELTEKLSQEYQRYDMPEDKRRSINESIQDLQNDVKNLKPETELKDLSLSQQKQIDAKTTTVIEKVIHALPSASEVISSFTPLSPF